MFKYRDFLKEDVDEPIESVEETSDIELEFEPNEKMRKSVYDIVSELKENENVKFPELSDILKNRYKIEVEPDLLKEILTDWDLRKKYNIFKKEDEKWLDVWGYMGYIKRKARYKQNFGKHRWKNNQPVYPKKKWIGGKWVYDPPLTPEEKKTMEDDYGYYANWYGGFYD